MATQSGPGRAHRKGIPLLVLLDQFPDDAAAAQWFAKARWPSGRYCPKCGSTNTTAPGGTLAYWCRDCRRRFSVTSGTALERTRLPLRKWVIAIYLYVSSLKGVSSMRLHRDLGITQRSAWFVLHRLRTAFESSVQPELQPFAGPVEVDETYVGGKRKNMHRAKRKELSGRGSVGKTPVVGVKDRATRQVRAQVVESTDRPTLHGFIAAHAAPASTVYTDDATAYHGMPNPHESVKHAVGEYVRDMAHTNGIESFWATLKRAHNGTFHQLSAKHLQRYVNEFSARHNIRDQDTWDQMQNVVAALVGKRLMYHDLIAD